MRNLLNKGESSITGIVALAILAIILFIFIIPAKKIGPTKGIFSLTGPTYSSFDSSNGNNNSTSGSYGSYSGTTAGPTLVADSSYNQSISLSTGNASYSYEPYEEYITIDNYGSENIDITGWTLKNGKDLRSYELGGTLRRYPADYVSIPKGTKVISPSGSSLMSDIVLGPGENAIVTTGNISSGGPYAITSFKENKCTGYLGTMDEYTFSPTLSQGCINPSNEYGIQNLDIACQDFIDRIPTCHTPKLGGKDSNGDACTNCADGTRVSDACINFIKSHYNYASCVYNHQSDPDFSLKTWRIFLGLGWELWAADHETITLLDRLGKIVNFRTY